MFSLRNLKTVQTTLWLAMLPIAVASGCSSTAASGPPPGPTYLYPDVGSFCSALASAKCSTPVLTACYGSASSTEMTSCQTAENVQAECNPTNGTYHPEYGQACVEEVSAIYGAYSSSTPFSHADFTQISKACDPVFQKDAGDGAPCAVDSDCSPGSGIVCLLPTGSTTGGTCETPVMVSAGGDCSAAASQCPDGYYCDSSQNCGQDRASGESCSVSEPCISTTACSGSTCSAKTLNGMSCQADSDCAGDPTSTDGGFCLINSMPVGNTTGVCYATDTLNPLATNCAEFLPPTTQ
jgi:hypothetical protein